MQLANVSDQAMFSLFARYDRDLLDRYDVFFINAGFGSSDMHLEKCIDRLTEAMDPLLSDGGIFGKNLTGLQRENESITAYTLATDASGAAFCAQAVDYMKNTAVLQGLGALMSDTFGKAQSVSEQEEAGKNPMTSVKDDSYERLEAESEEAKAAAEAAKADEEAKTASGEVTQDAEGTGPDNSDGQEAAVTVPDDFVNPLPALKTVGKLSVLNLVLQDTGSVSGASADTGGFPDAREKESGIGLTDVKTSIHDSTNSLIFNEYILNHYGTFRQPEDIDGLKYQSEYILMGKDSDIANLEAVVNRILLIRFGANLIHINQSGVLRGQIESASAAIASLILLPQASKVIEVLLAAGWAYCESLVDVRGLLDGDKIPLIKNETNWQVQLSDIPGIIGNMDVLRKRSPSGMSYKDYLRVLLFMEDADTRVSRSMNMTEYTMRRCGHENFRLDLCLDALTVDITARAEGRLSFTTEKSMCYRDL